MEIYKNNELLSNQSIEEICEALNKCLADTVSATWQAQQYHWNVKGMSFGALHTAFQSIYEDHFVAQDELAERIKALGGIAGKELTKLIKLSSISECPGDVPTEQMIRNLAATQKLVSRTLCFTAEHAAKHGDLVTEDLCITRAQIHDKFSWLISAHLE